MILFACLWLLAAATSVELADEVYGIPPHDWRYMELGLKQRPALMSARYEVDAGPGRVRLVLMTAEDLQRLRAGIRHNLLALTPASTSGRLDYDLPQAGDYVMVVENRGDAEAVVHLRVWLDFSGRHRLTVTRLSPERQAAVIAISLAVFFAIVSYSARRLLRGIRR